MNFIAQEEVRDLTFRLLFVLLWPSTDWIMSDTLVRADLYSTETNINPFQKHHHIHTQK